MRLFLLWCLILVTGLSASAWERTPEKTIDCREKKILVMPIFSDTMRPIEPSPAEMAKILADALKASGLNQVEAFSKFPATHDYLYSDLVSCFEMVKTEMPEYDGVICGTVYSGSNFFNFPQLMLLLKDEEGTLYSRYLLLNDPNATNFPDLAAKVAENNRNEWEKIRALPDKKHLYETLPVKATKVVFINPNAQLPNQNSFPLSDYDWWLAAAKQNRAAFILTDTGDALYNKMTQGVGEENYDFPEWQWYDAIAYDDPRIERLNSGVSFKSMLTLPKGRMLCKSIVIGDRCYLWYAGGTYLQDHKIYSLDFKTQEIVPLAGGMSTDGVGGDFDTVDGVENPGVLGSFGSFSVEWPLAVSVFGHSLLIFDLEKGTMTEIDDTPYDPKSAALLNKTLYVWMGEAGGGALMKCATDGSGREILYDFKRPEKRGKLFAGGASQATVAVIPAPERGTVFLLSENLIQECEADGTLKNATIFDYSDSDRYIQNNNRLFFAANYVDRNGFATLDLKTGEIDGKFCFVPMPSGSHAVTNRSTVHNYDRAFFGESRGNVMVWNNSDLCFVLGKRSYLLNAAEPEKSPLWAMPENQQYTGSRFDAYPSPDSEGFWIVSPLGYAAEIVPKTSKSTKAKTKAKSQKQKSESSQSQEARK